MLKKLFFTSGGLALVIGSLYFTKVFQFKAMAAAGAAMTPPPELVTTATVQEETWAPTIDAVGSLAAVQGVNVAAELDGKVVQIAFEAGRTVHQGDLLVQQDTSTEEAQLRAAEAAVSLTQISLKRARELIAQKTISQSELDTAEAQFKQAVAQADNIRAAIAKKTIRAPFSGRLGLRLVNDGQMLRAGDAIVSLQTLDPIYVNFSLPQQELADLNLGTMVHVTCDASPGQTFDGRITAINPDVDAATRNVRVEATLANQADKLRPGMFASVAVVLPAQTSTLAIPATSVVYAPYGDSVFVVEEKQDEKTHQMEKIVRQQFVRLGATRGDFVSVVNGLKAGDTVVSSGVFKLRPGEPVQVDNRLAPDAQLAPRPADS